MDSLHNLAAAAAYIPFLNLQYIYCFFVSLFGSECTTDASQLEVPQVDIGGAISNGVDVATTTAQAAGDAAGGFWSWLWPFHGSGAAAQDAASSAAAQDPGFWTSAASSIPAPIEAVIHSVGSFVTFVWNVISWVSFSISGLIFLAIVAAVTGLILIRIKEWSDYGTLPPRPSGKTYGWSRWQDLLDAAMSGEPKRWREAIVEADGMLGELLTRLGYHGEVTAVQLRSVPEGAFVTLAQAWEAHRIKNFVAQRNSDFILTQREAFRIMKLYEQVFEEFDFI